MPPTPNEHEQHELAGEMSDGSESLQAGPSSISDFPTALAPSFPAALPGADFPCNNHMLDGFLKPGARIGEFELEAELGRGAFGCVFLARQTSLGRLVALKITADEGSEGRSLAQLEHENIVQVYSELVDVLSGYRLLCMQYVAGPTLQEIVEQLHGNEDSNWSGSRILEIIDGIQLQKTAFDPTALRDREFLERSDWIETVCWIGGSLAEALAYAAERGVLHRDIKPANILLSQYGRPLLADFNLAFRLIDRDEAAAVSFGGTLAYMSPESLDAFNPGHPAGPEVTDARSDIYALGVVLFQLRHGHLPFDTPPGRGSPTPVVLSRMAAERRNQPPRIRSPRERHAFDTVIQRCLAPNLENRYASGNELAAALEGCRQLRQAEKQLPAPTLLLRPAFQWTFIWLIGLGLIPHLIGSGIQIGYNTVRIVGQLTPLQYEAFTKLVIGYNLVMYPICSAWLVGKVLPVFQAWRGVRRGGDLMGDELDEARQQAVELPLKAVLVGCVGWFPGAIIFPLGLYWLSGPLPLVVAGHFVISFVLAGLIALTYSFLGTQLVILRVMYARMWHNPQGFRQTTERELRPIESRVRLFQLLAGTIPLAGAILIVVVSPQADHVDEYDAFRLLVSILILLGMAGVQFANLAHRQISQMLAIYTNR